MDITGGKTDSVPPVNASFTYNPVLTTYTKESVKVGISSPNATGYTLQYKTEKTGAENSDEVNDWTDYTGEITLTRNQSVYARLVDSTKQNGATSTGAVTNIDTLAPSIESIVATEKKTNSITVVVTASDAVATTDSACSGIAGYRFSCDNGANWTQWQASNSYAFTGLKQGTEYKIKAEVKDKAGKTKTIATTAETINVPKPTILCSTTSWTNRDVTVTITGETGYTLQTSTNGKNWNSEDKTTVTKKFTANGTVYARLSDGTNNGEEVTKTIANIDKTAPTVGTLSYTQKNCSTVTFKLASASDAGSKISKIVWYYKKASESAYSSVTTTYSTATSSITNVTKEVSGLEYGVSYVAYAEVYDVVGNKGTSGEISNVTTKEHSYTYTELRNASTTIKKAYNFNGVTVEGPNGYRSDVIKSVTGMERGQIVYNPTLKGASIFTLKKGYYRLEDSYYDSSSKFYYYNATYLGEDYYIKACSSCGDHALHTEHNYGTLYEVDLKSASQEVKDKFSFNPVTVEGPNGYRSDVIKSVTGMERGQIVYNPTLKGASAFTLKKGYYRLEDSYYESMDGFYYYNATYLGETYNIRRFTCDICGHQLYEH